METSFIILLPAILVLGLALITRNVLASLLIGIFSASYLATNGDIIKTALLGIKRIFEQTGVYDVIYQTGNYDKIFLFSFLLFLSILLEIITHTGGMRYYTRALMQRLHNAKQAQFMTLFLSFFFFMDDYLNCLMVGSIMRPVTDHFKVPRAKLAYLLNCMTSPLAVLIPATSWIGMIVNQFITSGVNTTLAQGTLINIDPFYFYLLLIPFLFYPAMSVVSGFYIVSRNISYGIMKRQEHIARQDGNLFGGKDALIAPQEPATDKTSALDITLPLSAFILFLIGTLLYSGSYHLLGGNNSFFQAIINANTTFALFMASTVALICSTFLFLLKKQGTLTTLSGLYGQGFVIMYKSLAVLIFAWAFSYLLQYDLQTGKLVAQLLLKTINIYLLPLIVFLAAAFGTASIGSSWGVIMLLMPLILPVIVNLVGTPPLAAAAALLVAPTIGALVAGSVAGAHFSPITDSNIIASTSSQCYHMDHVRNMIAYSVPPLVGASLACILIGLLSHYSLFIAAAISFVAGLALCIALHEIRNRKAHSDIA